MTFLLKHCRLESTITSKNVPWNLNNLSLQNIFIETPKTIQNQYELLLPLKSHTEGWPSLCLIHFSLASACKGPFALDDNDIIFLSSNVNGLIGNHATHFTLSSEKDATPIPDNKHINCRRQVWMDPND